MNAEERLIGAALLDIAVFHEAALQYSQFLDPVCQVIWKGIGKCIDKNTEVDPITVSDELNGKLSPSQISKYVVHSGAANVQQWAAIIRDGFVQRGVALLSSNFSSWTASGLSGPDMLSKIRTQLEKLENATSSKLPTLAELSVAEVARLRSEASTVLRGLPSGIGLERVVPGGISKGRVTTFFGESGNFKTTVKNAAVLGIAAAGFRVLDISLEDANELTAHRHIAAENNLNYGKVAAGVLTTTERASLQLSEQAIATAENIIMGGNIIPNIDEIIRTTRYYKNQGGLDAVFIDYVQLLESRNPRQTQKELLDEIMRKCQLAAKRDNIAYIVVSQVKQDVDQRTDHTPRITDMIGSSAMRTASKLSIGVYRPGLYYKVPPKNSGYENLFHNAPDGEELYKNMLELHLLKNVLGEPKVVVHCNVNPGTGKITPFDMRQWK